MAAFIPLRKEFKFAASKHKLLSVMRSSDNPNHAKVLKS